MRNFFIHVAKALWMPFVILGVWWLSTKAHWVTPLLLPSPEAVGQSAWEMIQSGEWVEHVRISVIRAFSGFGISASLALVLAWWLAHCPALQRHSYLTLHAIRVIPPLSLVPLLILWLGIGEAPKLAIVILASFFPVYLSALTGFQSTQRKHRELAVMLHLTPKERFWHIELPSALPGVLTGLRLGFGYAWRALVGAELIAASSGLGYLISDASEMSRSDAVMVGILTIAILGLIADIFFVKLIAHWAPWSVSFKRED